MSNALATSEYLPQGNAVEPAARLHRLESARPVTLTPRFELFTVGADPNKITAITLLAGVEPILTSAPKGRQGMVLGNWNLGGGMGVE